MCRRDCRTATRCSGQARFKMVWLTVTRKSSGSPRNDPVRGGSRTYSTSPARTRSQNFRGEIQTLPPRQTILADRFDVLDRSLLLMALMGISSAGTKQIRFWKGASAVYSNFRRLQDHNMILSKGTPTG